MQVTKSNLYNLIANDFMLSKLWEENLAWYQYYKSKNEENGMSYTKYMAYLDLHQKCVELKKEKLDKQEEKIIKDFVNFYFS